MIYGHRPGRKLGTTRRSVKHAAERDFALPSSGRLGFDRSVTILPLRPRRPIEGISAVLLPFTDDGRADRDAWAALVERTWVSGLTPAVNMDTGHANLLTRAERAEMLALTK